MYHGQSTMITNRAGVCDAPRRSIVVVAHERRSTGRTQGMVVTDLTCPRCGSAVAPPSAWSSSWRCAKHGDIAPLRQVRSLSPEGLAGLLRNAAVPVMLPWPLPDGWLVTRLAAAGDERTWSQRRGVAVSSPNPGGGSRRHLAITCGTR